MNIVEIDPILPHEVVCENPVLSYGWGNQLTNDREVVCIFIRHLGKLRHAYKNKILKWFI